MPRKSKESWSNKNRMVKKDDNLMHEGLPTDIVIPVMGPTGVGKSTFINALLAKDVMPVGHDITSCTAQLEYAIIDNLPHTAGHRVIIVDTPGFDDTYEDDVEILRRIAVWLASSYNDGMKLGGVIYLQSIADKRMKGTTRRNLDMFRQLCGEKALRKVVFGTTNWAEVGENIGKRREQQLKDKFWKKMTDSGSKLMRFEQTQESAQAFLDVILGQLEPGKGKDNVLQVQKELVDHQRTIPETAAGKELRDELKQVRDMQGGGGDFEMEAAHLASIRKQVDELKIPLGRKIKNILGL